MAKKSAKSKGYRKNAGKKPYLSKRDIIMLCVILAVVAAGAILLFSYDDGALKVKGGKIVDAGENWLIVNGAANSGKRYYKLAEMDEQPGYEMAREPMPTDENLSMFKYTPEDEASDVQSIVVAGSAVNSERQAEYYRALMTEFSPSEVSTATAGDLEYRFFTYSHAYYEEEEAPAEDTAEAAEETPAEGTTETAEEAQAEDTAEASEEAQAEDTAEASEEAQAEDAAADAEAADEPAEAADDAEAEVEPNRFQVAINAFVDGGRGSVSITAVCESDTEAGVPDEAALKGIVEKTISAIRLEPVT